MKALFYISFGVILQGLAMALFLFPYDIPSGGAAGIAILLNYFFELPYGVSLWLFNFSILLKHSTRESGLNAFLWSFSGHNGATFHMDH